MVANLFPNKKHAQFYILSSVRSAMIFCAVFLYGYSSYAAGLPFDVPSPSPKTEKDRLAARLAVDFKAGAEQHLRISIAELSYFIGYERSSLFRGRLATPPFVIIDTFCEIENPTDKAIVRDFGFPIIRDPYLPPNHKKKGAPPIFVVRDKQKNAIKFDIISYSAIYGRIREQSRRIIDAQIKQDGALAERMKAIREATGQRRRTAQKELTSYLKDTLKWSEEDAALLAEYATLDFDKTGIIAFDRSAFWKHSDKNITDLAVSNIGALAAIGEQRATQFFARLAGRFDPKATARFEGIYASWLGQKNLTERVVTFAANKAWPKDPFGEFTKIEAKPGVIQMRETSIKATSLARLPVSVRRSDPALYARLKWYDRKAKLSTSEVTSCQVVLRNLPDRLPFPLMNLLHYRKRFPPKSKTGIVIAYCQLAVKDSHALASYQIQSPVYPLMRWKSHRSIKINVNTREPLPLIMSVPFESGMITTVDEKGWRKKHKGAFTIRFQLFSC